MEAGSPCVTRSSGETKFRRLTAATPLVKAGSSISENSVCLLLSAATVWSCASGEMTAFARNVWVRLMPLTAPSRRRSCSVPPSPLFMA